MQRIPASAGHVASVLLAAVCCACAGGPLLPTLPSPDLSALSVGSLAGEPGKVQIASAEAYSRIARGANACWFGPRGRFGKSHILHADAAPSMNGGAVEIVVHERAVDQPKPWGYKAYRVVLTESPGLDGSPGGGGTSIAVENSRIPDAEAARMRAEVYQWAAGTEGCKTDPALDKPSEPIAAVPDAKPAQSKSTQSKPTQSKSTQSAARKATPKAPSSGGPAPVAPAAK